MILYLLAESRLGPPPPPFCGLNASLFLDAIPNTFAAGQQEENGFPPILHFQLSARWGSLELPERSCKFQNICFAIHISSCFSSNFAETDKNTISAIVVVLQLLL